MTDQTRIKHTPGPWTAAKCAMSRDEWRISNPNAWPIFTVLCGRPEARANARLIAAAPDLLAALRPVAELSAYECPFCDPDKITLQVGAEHNCSEVPDARAAIAKAEGEG